MGELGKKLVDFKEKSQNAKEEAEGFTSETEVSPDLHEGQKQIMENWANMSGHLESKGKKGYLTVDYGRDAEGYAVYEEKVIKGMIDGHEVVCSRKEYRGKGSTPIMSVDNMKCPTDVAKRFWDEYGVSAYSLEDEKKHVEKMKSEMEKQSEEELTAEINKTLF